MPNQEPNPKPEDVKEPREEGLDETTCSPSSLTPETDAAIEQIRDALGGIIDRIHPHTARKMERERNYWRNEHDRVVREYQHRLMELATAAITASHYPEND